MSVDYKTVFVDSYLSDIFCIGNSLEDGEIDGFLFNTGVVVICNTTYEEPIEASWMRAWGGMWYQNTWKALNLNLQHQNDSHTHFQVEVPRHVRDPDFFREPHRPPQELSEWMRYVGTVNEERLSQSV